MKVISIGTDRKIFEENSSVRERQIEYGKLFEESHIVIFSKYGMGSKVQIAENVWAYPTNSKSKVNYIFDAIKIAKDIVKNPNDFVVSTQDAFDTGVVGLILKLRYKLPLQVQLHTDFANRYFIFHSLLNLIRFPLGIIVLSFADSVRVVSERIVRSIYSLSHNIAVLPIFTNHYSSYDHEKIVQSANGEKVKFLSVCRIEKEKDLETAVRAFAEVSKENQNFEFTIVGDGSQKRSLELLVKNLNLGDKIKFVGWQENPNEFYKNSDVYVSTSLYEGYGISVVEAAGFGLALIISDAGIASDYFKTSESALIFKPNDKEDLTRKIKSVIHSPDLIKDLGSNGKKIIESKIISKGEYLNRYKDSLEEALRYSKLSLGIFKRNILLRYLVAGFTGAFTQIGLLYILTDIFDIWYIYSSLISFAIALCVSFVLQKMWTFRESHTNDLHTQFAKYLSVALFGMGINTLSMYLLVEVFGFWYILAQIITGALIACINFLAYKFFIFNKDL